MRAARLLLALAFTVPASLRAQAAPDSLSLVARGRTVFEGKQGGALCVSCHGPKGKGVPGLGPDLTDATWLHGDGGAEFLRAIIRTGVAKPKAGVLTMPPLGGGRLDDEQLAALAAYVLSLRER